MRIALCFHVGLGRKGAGISTRGLVCSDHLKPAETCPEQSPSISLNVLLPADWMPTTPVHKEPQRKQSRKQRSGATSRGLRYWQDARILGGPDRKNT